ncbi:putative Ubiquitin conjugating enzyme [Melia azedarach]|uniref:Ubiquitin conjugating enzyme n=1 Tax=Melia azedarach TaxID=155640 RepID=A0ACC1Z236_MELAZ|nr:putative Ubiquitin conjugating enzyme [Melia azedarach]
MDDDVICQKLQPDEEAIIHDFMNFARDESPSEILIGDGKVDLGNKGKTKMCYNESWQNQVKDASTSDPGKSSTSGSISQFDNVDLPPGVEASVPWLKELAPSQDITSAASSSSISDLSESKRKATIPDLTESKRKATVSDLGENTIKISSSNNSSVLGESSSVRKEENGGTGVTFNFLDFKQFDTVDEFSDHHYSGAGFGEEQPPKNWAKKIQEEWKILEKNLPDTIFVRVCEARMELLRAVMIGPSGTPYHDGLFVFDCLFPPSYPNEPPRVYYYSGGLRLNPNLYECGKVCLSLLGTWSGKSTEMWDKKNSTMLQVLVSIQALILNARPFFNEPGYERSYVGEEGERRSRSYNEDTFILSLKTMMYTLRKPPKHFEALVADHFRSQARDILVACKAYMDGAVVGYDVVRDGVPEIGQADGGNSLEFKHKLGQMMNILVTNFTRNGATDCEQFRTSGGRQ